MNSNDVVVSECLADGIVRIFFLTKMCLQLLYTFPARGGQGGRTNQHSQDTPVHPIFLAADQFKQIKDSLAHGASQLINWQTLTAWRKRMNMSKHVHVLCV